jgi:hypothetical protein
MPQEPLLSLSAQRPFAQGGNRLCFVHPLRREWCVKVPCPAAKVDDNTVEEQELSGLPSAALGHVPRLHGWVATDLGRGLITDLFRDADGRVSCNLKWWLCQHGMQPGLEEAINEFGRFIKTGVVPTKTLLPHNLVAQRLGPARWKLWLIDGFGVGHAIPVAWQPLWWRAWRARARVKDLHERVARHLQEHGASGAIGAAGMRMDLAADPFAPQTPEVG